MRDTRWEIPQIPRSLNEFVGKPISAQTSDTYHGTKEVLSICCHCGDLSMTLCAIFIASCLRDSWHNIPSKRTPTSTEISQVPSRENANCLLPMSCANEALYNGHEKHMTLNCTIPTGLHQPRVSYSPLPLLGVP